MGGCEWRKLPPLMSSFAQQSTVGKIRDLYKDSYRLNRVVMADGFKSDNWFLIFYFTLAPFRHFLDTFSRLSSPTQI